MKLRRSVALGVMFPDSRYTFEDMERTLRFLSDKAECVEFYYEGENRPGIRRILSECGLSAIYIAVIPLKEQKADLCSLDTAIRARALTLLRECVENANALGCDSVMVCSGRIPADPRDIPEAERLFVSSMREIMDYSAQKGYTLRYLLEPCDSHMDARHLIGPTDRAIRLVEEVRAYNPAFSLTMDTAHLLEEGEDIAEALRRTKHLCNHVHFANCITKDPADPLYGDKHLSFDWPGGELGFERLNAVYWQMKDIYDDGRTITLTLETLSREDDPKAHFLRMAAGFPFWKRKEVTA